jgi:hypothetical protein
MSIPLQYAQRRVANTTRRFFWSTAPALAAVMGLGVLLALPGLREPVSFDGAHTYLPLARRLLAEGFDFLRSPDSIVVAPLAFLYPALLGAGEATVRWANVAAYAATIAIAWHALTLAHSRHAGWTAAVLLALSPTLHPYVANVLTEPPFVLLVAIWGWAVARVVVTEEPARGAIVAGAAAIALAALMRPATFAFLPAAAALLGVRWLFAPAGRRLEARLAVMHALALVPVALWILRNHALFGLPGIATGSGAALWLGMDPAVNGFDPVYFGLDYDTGAVTRDVGHLSIAGDRLLQGAARMEIADMSPALLTEILSRKAAAFLAMSPVELGSDLAPQRAWRMAVLACAIAGVVWQRHSPFAWVLAAFVAYMTAVHLPAMYHRRYSVGAIELPLTLLAAIGATEAARHARRWGLLATLVVFAVGIALLQLSDRAPGAPRIDRAPFELLWRQDVNAEVVLGPRARVELPIALPADRPRDYTATRLRMGIAPQAAHRSCGAMTIRYRYDGEASFDGHPAVRIPLRADGRVRDVTVGTTQPLHVDRAGLMRLEFDCDGPATLRLESVEVHSPRRAFVYRQKWLDHLAGERK